MQQGSVESVHVLCFQYLALEVGLYSRIRWPLTSEGNYYTKGKSFMMFWALRMCDQT